MIFLATPLGRLRLAGISEGISFLLLLFIAMPLKYFFNLPEAVKVIGWIHGLLFILYIMALINVKFSQRWNLQLLFIGFVVSLLPFGTFVFDKRLKEESLRS